ncbi:MAG: alpha/beta hydrolase [Burkholderiaceae bacterium]
MSHPHSMSNEATVTPSTEHQVNGLQVYEHPCTAPWVQKPETVIFHHGLGARAECWHGWFAALNHRFRIVTFDMRGHGASPVGENHTWSVNGMVDDLAAVANATVPANERFHLVGESIGGTNVLAYATQHPQRLTSLTVSNGAHQGGSLGNLSNWKEIMDAGGMKAWSAHMMTMRFRDGAIPEPMWQWYENQQAQCDQQAVLAMVELLIGADLSDQLSNITVPTLLLHPDSSPFIPVSVMEELKNQLPDARLTVFANSQHGLPFSHAGECAAAMAEFIGGLTS